MDDKIEYHIEIVKTYKPCRWGSGEWVKDDESLGGYRFTGKEYREFLGYQGALVMYVNGWRRCIIERVPKSTEHIHRTKESAISHILGRKHLSEGQLYSPFIFHPSRTGTVRHSYETD